MGARPDYLPADELVCPHCVGDIVEADHFCPHCGAPLTSHAVIDPVASIQAQGFAYRQAVTGRPTRMVVAGVWAIFAPQAMLLLGTLAASAAGPWNFMAVVLATGEAALLALFAAILVKVTVRRIFPPTVG